MIEFTYRALALVTLSMLAISCSGDSDTCTEDADCFAGTRCVGGTCAVVVSTENNNVGQNNTTSPNNTSRDAGNNGNHTSNNQIPNNRTTGSDGGSDFACVVDPFANQCTDDEWEENDQRTFSEAIWEQRSWCPDGELLTLRSQTLKYCANDPADALRVLMGISRDCLPNKPQATVKITVQIDTECDPSVISVEPFWFTLSGGLCDREEVRCSRSNDGLTWTFEFLHEIEAHNDWDNHVFIEAEENIQFDYTVTVEIL